MYQVVHVLHREEDAAGGFNGIGGEQSGHKKVRVRDKKAAREDPDVVAVIDSVSEKLGDNGRILVRESGTEPVIRVMVEAANDADCERYVSEVVDVIYQKGHAVAQ